jgi:lysophospholipase L1-like esterase
VSRTGRARRIAAAAAYGGGGAGLLTLTGVALLVGEAKLARRRIGKPFGPDGLRTDGVYGRGPGEPIELAVLGDSGAAGLGCRTPQETPSVILATGLAAVSGRPVRLTNVSVVGAESSGLEPQLARLLVDGYRPDAAVVVIGANDVTHRARVADAVRELTVAVQRLREAGAEVVVGTCPDLGTLEPVAQPLRTLARRLSRQLAAAQTIAVVEVGGRTVSLGDVVGPEFAARPGEMFSADRFHPSPAGYARMASVMLPSVCAALGLWPDGGTERAPEPGRGEGVTSLALAAVAAADDAGTEVAPARVGGAVLGPLGRWAMILRRRRTPLAVLRREQPDDDGSSGDVSSGDGSHDEPQGVPAD